MIRTTALMTSLAVSALTASASLPARAQTAWEFQVTPYVWFAGLDGDLGAVPGFPAQSVSLSFGDIWDDLDYAGFLYASARHGPWVIYFDGSIVQATSSETVNGPNVERVEVESRTSNVALAFGRTVAASDRHRVDAYLGFRAWWLDNEFTVDTTSAGRVRADSDADWVDPLVGVAGSYALDGPWTLFGRAEVGGFGVGADVEWGLLAGASYAFNDWFALSGGWRYLSVDYDDEGIVYDVDQSGPVLGATFRF